MNELNLPIIKDMPLRRPKKFSMDEYLEFVEFNLNNIFNKDAYMEWKSLTRVNVPFVIKEGR